MADKLVEMGFPANTILEGYLKATKKSIAIINESGRNVGEDLDEHLFEGREQFTIGRQCA